MIVTRPGYIWSWSLQDHRMTVPQSRDLERGWRTIVAHTSSVYGENCDPIPSINEPTTIFIINRTLRKTDRTGEDVYQATRRAWVIGEQARERAVYALGVSHGVVRGAFLIDRWIPEGDRWCFDGRTAPELSHVVGTSIARIKAPQRSSNPVRHFLDGIPAAEQ